MNVNDLKQKQDVIDSIKAFIADPKGFLLLSGKNGTGKSYAALAAYNAISPFVYPGYDMDIAFFITQADLNMMWTKHLAAHGETVSLLQGLTSCKLLVLDDIGTRTPSEPFMDFLYTLADKRWMDREKHATIVTTNLNAADMREKFGDAFVSRVASGKCFRFEGKDRRFNRDVF